MEKAKAEAYDERLKSKMKTEFVRHQENKKVLKEQLQALKLKVVNDYHAAALEGSLLQRQALEEAEDRKLKELKKKQ